MVDQGIGEAFAAGHRRGVAPADAFPAGGTRAEQRAKAVDVNQGAEFRTADHFVVALTGHIGDARSVPTSTTWALYLRSESG